MNNDTQFFNQDYLQKPKADEIIRKVYEALIVKGYNPTSQIIGYLISGDPTYITSYNNARSIIMKIDRDELLEELLNNYIETVIEKVRILALDYGDKTVGVAITDGLNLMAHPMNTIFREKPTKLRQTLSKIIEIIDENKVKTIVIGLPKNLDGSEKDRCTKTYEFANKLRTRLQNRDIEIIMHDERYSTTEANSIMDDIKIPKTERKKTIDSIAASIILESYLNEVNNG